MKKIEKLTKVIAENLGETYYGTKKNVFPLLVKSIIINGEKRNIHICRLGLSDAQYISEVLVYIDGYGGIIEEVETKYFYEKKTRKKIEVDAKQKMVYFDYQSVKKQVTNLQQKDGKWGYFKSQTEFVEIEQIPQEPIYIDTIKYSSSISFDEIYDIHNPNVLIFKPEDMEHALQIISDDGKESNCLHDNWHTNDPEETKKTYDFLSKITDTENSLKEISNKFYQWRHGELDEEESTDETTSGLQKVIRLTPEIMSNLGYDEAKLLLSEPITIGKKQSHIDVYILGLQEYADEEYSVLIYLQGFGGIIRYINKEEHDLYDLKLFVEPYDTFISLNSEIETEINELIKVGEKYGYYDKNNNFIEVSSLQAGGIKTTKYEFLCMLNFEEVLVAKNPNIIIEKNENCECTLGLMNHNGSQVEGIQDSWFEYEVDLESELEDEDPDTINGHFKKIRQLCQQYDDVKVIHDLYFKWHRSL